MDCYSLPISINIDGKDFAIRNKGDYRVILDCFDALYDIELDSTIRVYTALIIFYEDLSDLDDVGKTFGDKIPEAVEKMYDFFNCGKDSIGAKCSYKLIDWQEDSQMISAEINNVAKKEVRQESYVHWWTFMGYFYTIGRGTLSTVVGIRWKLVTGKPLEKHEREFKRENPKYFAWSARSTAQQENDELLKSIWNKS